MSFFDFLKNVFIFLLILQFLPPLVDGLRKQYGRYLEPKSRVAIVTLNKVIYDSLPTIRQLHTFFKDKEIKAIVLRIDSPGTASGTGQAIHDEIVSLKKEHIKPVIVQVENICASGAYWIATAADYIIAPGTSMIGSIGATFSHLFQLKDFLEQYKISTVTVKAGTYKNVGDPFSTMAPEEQEMLQHVLDDSYHQFVQSVAAARKLSPSHAHEYADGRLFTGQQALKLGLIDELGSFSTLTKTIKDRALVEGEIEWVHQQQPSGWWHTLFGSTDNSDDNTMFSAFVNAVQTALQRVCIV